MGRNEWVVKIGSLILILFIFVTFAVVYLSRGKL